MVEPDSDEKTVPPIMVTMDNRPGTREISRSMAPMALNATPVCKSISPISKKRAMGAREKLMALLNSIGMKTRPISPLMNRNVPRILAAKKAKATGRPMNIKTQTVPSRRMSALYHSMTLKSVRTVVVSLDPENPVFSYPEKKFDGQHGEGEGEEGDRYPIGDLQILVR